MFIEIYDASSPLNHFVREVLITYSEDNDEKFEDTASLHKRTNFATNGQILSLHNPKKTYTYYFDIKTGQQISKIEYSGSKPSNGKTCYDNVNNIFYHINFGEDAKLYSFSINNF